ncbi:CoA-transferase subunit beta [Undibacterium arcticum]
MTDIANFTAGELLAVMSSRFTQGRTNRVRRSGRATVVGNAGTTSALPRSHDLVRGGVVGPIIEPGALPPSTNEQRCTKRANMVLSSTDVLLLLQRGYVDIGFMGGAQIDMYGNLNSSYIGNPANPKTRLPGTGGGNDISSLTHMIVAMKHERRRFVEKVDFVTSPGFLNGGTTRRDQGLLAGGMYRVVTDLGIFGFDDRSKKMKVVALHPGVSIEQVHDNTGFRLAYDQDITVTELPTERELGVLRELDPERLYIA